MAVVVEHNRLTSTLSLVDIKTITSCYIFKKDSSQFFQIHIWQQISIIDGWTLSQTRSRPSRMMSSEDLGFTHRCCVGVLLWMPGCYKCFLVSFVKKQQHWKRLAFIGNSVKEKRSDFSSSRLAVVVSVCPDMTSWPLQHHHHKSLFASTGPATRVIT